MGDYDFGEGTVFTVDGNFRHAVEDVEAGDKVAEDGVFVV